MSEAWKVWERTVAAHAQAAGLPWDRRLRLGDNHDLLDMDGCLPGGWLVGCKSIRRLKSFDDWLAEQDRAGKPPAVLTLVNAYRAGQKASFGAKISEAMDQCDRALLNIGRPSSKDGNGRLLVDCGGIIPVQVMQRSGYPPGKAYVVTQLDYLLDLAVRRQKWRDDE